MRLSMNVTLTPFSKWDKENPQHKNVLKNRMKAVKRGHTLNMWPHEFHKQPSWNTDGKDIPRSTYTLPELDELKLRLIRGPEPLVKWDRSYSYDFIKSA